jgi:hypothetical protein
VNLGRVQNVFYQLLQNVYPVVALEGDSVNLGWLTEFEALGARLEICVEPVALPAVNAS